MTSPGAPWIRHTIQSADAQLHILDSGGELPPLILLHGLAGSARELLPTAQALMSEFRVLLPDQRGHGRSTRRPRDLSRRAFVADVLRIAEACAPGRRLTLVGQSMGAHTAFLTASAAPELVERLVMLEGHAGGSDDPNEAEQLRSYFASWPVPFADEAAARAFLGDGPLERAWIADLEPTSDGLRPRFDAEVMAEIITAVHVPLWAEWDELETPTTVVFAGEGMFSPAQRDELIARRPATRRVDLVSGSHDAHLDAFEEWTTALRAALQ